VTNHGPDPDRLARLRTPRRDLVVEAAAGPDRFACNTGPFSDYERRIDVGADGTATETITAHLALPYWWIAFALPVRYALRHRPSRDRPPWWAPPTAIDARTSHVLGLLCALAVIEGYVGTLLTQTVTYAATEFGENRSAQGMTLAAVRGGVLLALVLTARADRHGRRPLLGIATTGACIAAAAGALAPGLVWLGASQMVATGCAGAVGILIAIVAAEELPAGCRAYGLSLVVMAGALGAGMCVWVLPAADTGTAGWRIVYLVPLAGLVLGAATVRRLPESRRFAQPHRTVAMTGRHRQLRLLAATGFLGALFVAPAFQFQNDFLRREHGFSASRIALFTVLTSTPAAIGIIAGGRLADVHGRRRIAAAGVIGGTIATVAMFAVAGWPLWLWSAGGSIVGALVVPSLGVYRPELFPTSLRGTAAGVIEAVALTGSAAGLLVVGRLADRWDSYLGPLALVAAGPALVAVLVLWRFPETARVELEALNPEDGAGAASAPP
jgi:MFS family permease